MAQKYQKILPEVFIDDNKTISEDEALKLIAESEFAMKQIANDKEADDKLSEAKLICKDLNAGYNSATRYERAKIEFLLERVEAERLLKMLGLPKQADRSSK